MTKMQGCTVLLRRRRDSGLASPGRAQTPAPAPHHAVAVPLQPFAVLARRVETALDYLGQPLAAADRQALAAALANTDEHAGVTAATAILDRYALVHVHINPESRVKVTQGAAAPALVQAGTRVFLVKVVNEAGITAPLRVTSPQSRPVSLPSRGAAGAAADDLRARHQGALGRRLAVRQAAADRAAVRSAARVPHHRDLQPRCGPAGRRPVV